MFFDNGIAYEKASPPPAKQDCGVFASLRKVPLCPFKIKPLLTLGHQVSTSLTVNKLRPCWTSCQWDSQY